MTPKLTRPQYEALCKWEASGPAHQKALKVRDDVFWRLLQSGMIEPSGLLVKSISGKGREALAAYRASWKAKP